MKRVYAIPIYYTMMRYFVSSKRKSLRDINSIIDMNFHYFFMLPMYLIGYLYILIKNPSLYSIISGFKLIILSLIFYVTTQTIYEVGYLINDNIAYFKEGKKGRNVFGEFLPKKEVIGYSVLRLILFAVFVFMLTLFIPTTYVIRYIEIMSILMIVFIAYNSTIPKNRAVYLFFPLRLLKYTAMLFPLSYIFNISYVLPYIIASSIEGTIGYVLRKIPEEEIKLNRRLYQVFLQLLITSGILYIELTIYNVVDTIFTIITLTTLSFIIIISKALAKGE